MGVLEAPVLRRCKFPLMCASLSATLFACDSNKNDAAKTRSLVILHTNDEHLHMLGAAPDLDDFPAPTAAGTGLIQGGAGRRAVLLQQERDAAAAAKADTLTVSAGDNAMSTLFQVPFASTGPDYQLMNALKYDVTTIGNHELDFGPDGL